MRRHVRVFDVGVDEMNQVRLVYFVNTFAAFLQVITLQK